MNVPGFSSQRMPQRVVRRWLQGVLLASASLASLAAMADVPGRVGRVSFMQGDVQSYSDTEPEWKVAYVNEPITSRNSLFVGDGGRAEISVGSTTLAMEGGSQVDIQQLDDNTFNANVVRGRVSLRVRRIDPNDAYNVAAPGADFALLQPGRYRIDALDNASGITVFAGQASVQSEASPVTVPAGNAIRVVANPQDPDGPPLIESGPSSPVALDDWVLGREQRFVASQAQRYVSPNMTGYEDLDANGSWSTEADVGPVWYPSTYVRADWAPYRYGRWAYVEPWGYTWVDDAPWGFAPFHYGRWIEVGGRWGWTPGAYVARPVYAPALVGFYGGSGFTASFSIGSGPAVGWYPLAPWERFTPYYAHNAAYVNQVNNITIINAPPRFSGREGGWNREHGATVVPRDAFASQRSISRVAMEAPRGAFQRAAPVNAAELPRPSAVPGAVRRGPESPNGVARPEFRAPRDFAQGQPPRGGRPAEAVRGGPPPAGPVAEPRSVERSNLPPNYRRLPETERPGVAPNAQPAIPAVRAQERVPIDRAGPNAPNFSREGRPVPQPVAPAAENVLPNPTAPNIQRTGPRQQAMQRGDGEAVERARQQVPDQRNVERPNRDFRPPQPAQPVATPQVQPAERAQQRFERPQAPVERPQAPVERPQQPQRVERQQPAAPVAPAVPVAQPPRPQPAAAPGQPRPQPPGREEGVPSREQAR
jgi:hypothetical protein